MRNTTNEQVRVLISLMDRNVEVEMDDTQLAAQYARMAAIHQDSHIFFEFRSDSNSRNRIDTVK